MEKKAKVTDFLYKAFRVLVWVVFSSLLFLIFLALALQITPVQNWLIDRTAGYLTSNTNFRTEVDNIRITWWDAVELQGLRIFDHQDSLMLGASQANVDFAILSLIPPGDPTIDAIRLDRAEVNLLTHRGDSTMNINRWITELGEVFGSSSSTSSGPKFYIQNIELRQSAFALINFNPEPVETGLDFNRLEFGEITASADQFRLEGSGIGLKIKILTGTELNSNLNIQELKTVLTYSPDFIELDALSLKTPKSHIKDYLRMDLTGPDGFGDLYNQVKLTARMAETKVDLEDLRLFVPALPDFDDQIYLSGEVSGPISDIKSDEFLIRLGEKTALFGSFFMDGLPVLEETYINLSLKNSVISARDLAPYLSPELEREINKFNLIRFDADFAGLPTRFTTNGNFRTNIGNLDGRVNYDLVKGVPTIVSRLKVDNLDLGILAENRELLQKISLDGSVNFRGNSAENALIDLNAQISKLGVQNYTYSNIRTDATYGLNLFRGNLSINDPNLKTQVKGYLNLKESVDSVRLQVNLDTAFLDRINLVEKPVFLAGKLDIDTKGIKLDEIQGIGRFNDIQVGYEDRFLEVGDFFFQSLFTEGTRTLSINSDYLVAVASGNFNLEQIGLDLNVLGKQYLAILLNEEPPLADLEKNFSETYNLDLNVRMADINPILGLLQPDIKISKNTVLEGAFYQTPENTVFNFFTSIDTLIYNGNRFLGNNIDFNTSKIINSEDILASFYVYSKSQIFGQNINFSNLGLEAIWNQDLLDLQLSLDQDSTQSKARINAESRFSANGTQVKFNPSELKILNRDWQFDPNNLVTLQNGEIKFDQVKISNEEQYLSLEGDISSDPEANLQVIINRMGIDLLNTFTAQDFEGIADGAINLKNLYGTPLITGELNVEDMEINDFPIGEVESGINLQDSELLVKLENRVNNQKKIDVGGIIGLENENLELDIALTQANLVIFEPFLSKYISNLGGTATGNLQLTGTLSAPQLIGSSRIEQGQVKINYLNTNYQINGGILFEPTLISFRDMVLRDVNGNRATFTGGVRHNGFNDIYLDISSRLTNFQALNTTVRDNEVFYGTAYTTGTLDIRGSTTNLDITARATSQPNTRIFIPLTSSNDQYQEEFIQVINIQDTVRIQAIAEEVNRLEIENIRMNFILDITPDAFAEIIIDPKTGESIQGRGRGVLTMNIDTQGNFSLTGNYEIVEGRYNFSLYNLVKKDFEIRPGGRITWFGDPYSGIMNLQAEYEETVSLQPLITSTSSQENSQMRRRYPVKVRMNLQGELLSPNISFGFDFSAFPTNGDMQTTISAFQNRIAADEQEMNRQVFSVIMTRNFSPEGQFSGVSTISSNLGNLLSSQLNSMLSQVDKNLEVNIDLATLDQNALENFQLSVAYTFLDGRLRVSRDGGFTDNRGNANAASIIGDWQAEYLLTEDGVYRLRIFNRNNFNAFTSLSLSQNVLTYGASLTQNVSFNSFSELFRKLTRNRRNRLQVNDSDDFLRREYQGDETWTPIDLNKIQQRELPKIPPIDGRVPPKEDF